MQMQLQKLYMNSTISKCKTWIFLFSNSIIKDSLETAFAIYITDNNYPQYIKTPYRSTRKRQPNV